MKKRWIVLISAIALFLLAYGFIGVWDYMAVSYIEEKVGLDNIKPNETVLAKEVLNDAWGHQHYILVINKNKQVKSVDLSKEKECKELLPRDYDAILKDKNIAFEKEKLKVSNRLLSKIININNYKLKGKGCRGNDMATVIYYSVCGSGRNRKMVIMKEEGPINAQGKNIEINKLCDDMSK